MWLLDQKPKTLTETAKLADQYIELAVEIGSRMKVNPSRLHHNPGINHLQVPRLLHKAVRSRRDLRRKRQHSQALRLCVITAKSLDIFLLIAKSVLPSYLEHQHLSTLHQCN